MLEHSIIAAQSGRNKSDLPGITLQQMPYPCYIEVKLLQGVPSVVSTAFGFLFFEEKITLA